MLKYPCRYLAERLPLWKVMSSQPFRADSRMRTLHLHFELFLWRQWVSTQADGNMIDPLHTFFVALSAFRYIVN